MRLQIGQFARLSGLTIDTLRHYDRLGILKPVHVVRQSSYRLYDAAQLPAVNRILALKDAGFSLAEIASIQSGQPTAAALLTLLQEKVGVMQADLSKQQQRLDRLLSNIFLIKNGGIPMANEITLKSTEPITVCALRRRIPKAQFDDQLEEMWPLVNRLIQRQGAKRITPCLMLYYDGTWTHQGEELDVEVAEPLVGTMRGEGEIVVYDLPAVARMACVVHQGSFQTIGATYSALFAWLEQNRYQPKGPLREIYHVGDWATDDPDAYVTELQIPVE